MNSFTSFVIHRNNVIAFRINPGYPFEVVVKENNELINNKEDEVYSG